MIGMMTTVLGLGLALFISLEAYSQGGLFAWHPFLMSVGALGLPTAGIQAVKSRHAVGGMPPKTQRVQVCVLGVGERYNAGNKIANQLLFIFNN